MAGLALFLTLAFRGNHGLAQQQLTTRELAAAGGRTTHASPLPTTRGQDRGEGACGLTTRESRGAFGARTAHLQRARGFGLGLTTALACRGHFMFVAAHLHLTTALGPPLG